MVKQSTSYQKIKVRVECPNCETYNMVAFRHQVHDSLLGLTLRKCRSCGMESASVLYTYIENE